MGFVEFFAVAMAAAVMGIYLRRQYQAVSYVESRVDGKQYLVRDADDAVRAADTLARLNANIDLLIGHLETRYPKDERTRRLKERYDPDALSEGGHNFGYTSFSVDKGKRVVMCLRSRDSDGKHGDIEEVNTLMYVLLHELAHIVTEEIGHTDTFWENFEFLIREAAYIGIYDPALKERASDYCGMRIQASKPSG
jgi:hypothetical protein